jgi:adenylosuccinate lyase
MISRYTHSAIGSVWSEENKLRKWLDVELSVLDALAFYGVIPKNIPSTVRKKVKFNPKRILEIEKVVKHDVIAFLTNLSESAGPAARFIHYGLTSSDILDTGLALQVKEASQILEEDLIQLLAVLKRQARRYKDTVMAGRSHGVHAEPITFGLKLAVFYDEFKRNLARLRIARETMNYGKISGAVGTFANVEPKVEALALKKLGLKPAPSSTQILQRDLHAEYLTTLAIIGASLEKLAVEIRLLQKTETLEVEEAFEIGQKGSSAMPHKRNPITCEKVAGLARLLRANAMVGLENVALWHERDISHSSVERIIFPDSTIALDHMLRSMISVIRNLVVHPDNMLSNLKLSRGMVFSQGLLLKLIQKGLSREKAYALVQAAAKRTWDEKMTLREAARENAEISKTLSQKEIEDTFDYRYHTKNISKIFKRVGI